MDSLFRVEVLSATPNPQRVIHAAMHQDYSEDFVFDEMGFGAPGQGCSLQSEEWESGDVVVKHLLKGDRGHYGPLEHPQIVFNVGYFPHSTMQQLRTHRVGVSFDVQSFRYTGQRLYKVGDLFTSNGYIPGVWNYTDEVKQKIEEVIYLRPEGKYSDRNGNHYYYTEQARLNDLAFAAHALGVYVRNIDKGYSEEHARSLIPFDVRQHFVMSCNVRSLMHLLDLRAKKDAQLECQQLCELMFPHFYNWVPSVASWYKENRYKKARLAP